MRKVLTLGFQMKSHAAVKLANSLPAAALCLSLWAPGGAWAVDEAAASPVPRFVAELASECGGDVQSRPAGTRGCLSDTALQRLSNAALPMVLGLVKASGERLLGEHFSLTDDLSFRFGEGLQGNVDLVMPLAGGRSGASFQAGGSAGGGERRAWFVQQGASIWLDDEGRRRHDLRLGLVGRTPAWQGRGGVLGLSFFQQYNLERGHSRSVMGLDWAGPRATAAFNYYLPATGWVASSRLGYEEQALEGMEVSGRFELPHAFELEGAVSRWRIPGGSGYSRASRVGLSWQYNRWVELHTGWRASGIDAGGHRGWITGIQLSIPLGDRRNSPRSVREVARYEGSRARATQHFGAAASGNLWRPVEQEGQIAVAQRDIADARHSDGNGEVVVRFVQTTAESGNAIEMKVSLARPAARDLFYELRLRPGDGENPAVEGEDFNGAPILLRIPRGKTLEVVSAQLLLNDDMQTPRSLGVSIAPALHRNLASGY